MGAVLIYTRVSTLGQAIDGYGLDAQEDACRRWAALHGHAVVDAVQERGVSGTKDETERPVLADALLRLRDGDADLLLVSSLDRLARAVTVQEALLAVLWAAGGEVATADHGVVQRDDPDDPWRTAMREMAGVMAGLERRLIVKRLRDGRKAKARQGGKAVGRYPYGWDRDGEVPEEQATLLLIRERRAAGATWDAVADELNAGEVRPRSAPCWTPTNLSKVARRGAAERVYTEV
jgi:DNA invertase Pin-like site-specific DNA recombinase